MVQIPDKGLDARGDFVSLTDAGASTVVHLHGDWVIENAVRIDARMAETVFGARGGAVLDCSGVGLMDTTGAVLIRRYAKALEDAGAAVLTGVSAKHKNLLVSWINAPHLCKPTLTICIGSCASWLILAAQPNIRFFMWVRCYRF